MRAVKLSLSLALSLFFLYLTFFVPELGRLFRGELSLLAAMFGHPRFELSQFRNVLEAMRWGPIFITAMVFFVSLALRAWRWKIMLGAIVKMNFGHVFGAINIGYMANNILPFRMGEVYRAQVIYKLTGLSRTAAFGSVILERVTDLVFMVPYVGLAVLLYPLPGALRQGAYIISAASFVLTIFFVWTALDRPRVLKLVARLLSVLPLRVSTTLNELFARFTSGLMVLGRKDVMVGITLSSLALWALYAVMVYGVMLSLGFVHTNLPLIDANLPGAVLVTLIITTVGFVIPGAPGSVGTYHGVAVMGLSLFNVPGDRAAGFAFLLHAMNYIPLTLLGLFYFWKYGLTFRGAQRLAENLPGPAAAEQAMAEAARTK